jgi:glutamyl-tRNA reductase
MAILALGVSHRSAGVGLLERLSFADDDLSKAYRRASDDGGLREAVVLSTCNRVELYAAVDTYHAGFLSLKRLLCETRGVDPDELAEPLYSHYEEAAAEHLFTVAAGLDSMVLGEPQILSQVRAAQRRAVEEGAAGATLTALFHAAARAGRRVRSETGVGAAPDAFVDAGASLAEATVGGLAGRRAVVIGAGHMAALAAKHLRARGAEPERRPGARARGAHERGARAAGRCLARARGRGPRRLLDGGDGRRA